VVQKNKNFHEFLLAICIADSTLSLFMNIFQLENFFGNSSFFFLFFSMISYWVQIAFHLKKWNIGKISMLIANFCLLSLLILRWKESGHFPLSNLYESLMFLSWSFSTFHLILENIESGTNSVFTPFSSLNQSQNHFLSDSEKQKNFDSDSEKKIQVQKFTEKRFFVGAFTSPTALFINAFATFRLPLEMQHSSPLVPALQSNWLMMHVTVMILSYSALICGSLLSIAFLIVTKNFQFDFNSEKNFEQENIQVPSIVGSQTSFSPLSSNQLNSLPFSTIDVKEVSNSNFSNPQVVKKENGIEMKKKFAENLDNLSYRILGIGFPLLTIGILSGAVWANEAWGSYWSWDPKETWALATWLVFAIYLHLRISKGWRGKKPAILAAFGFVTVWICFLGVNLLGEGLHSYGFLKNSF
jgi:cytochrome c-type biogenesis protein CcsB